MSTKNLLRDPRRMEVGCRVRRCNLCGEVFRPRTRFERFCRQCKTKDELLRFIHWLPEADEPLTAKLSTA